MIYENILKLCKENHIRIARLEKNCGLGNATIRGWEHGDPGVKRLKRVADYFHVTVDSLLVENPQTPDTE